MSKSVILNYSMVESLNYRSYKVNIYDIIYGACMSKSVILNYSKRGRERERGELIARSACHD